MSEYQQMKEAVEKTIIARNTASYGIIPKEVLAAARSYLALLQECDQCPGDGVQYVTFKEPCPSCSGRGMVISDQAVEKGAVALCDRSRHMLGREPCAVCRIDSRAVLAAAIFGEETE